MALLEIRDFTFSYAGEQTDSLKDISLIINEGEMVVLCGPTGCGKTTLLRHMKKEIAPIGTRRGGIYFMNTELEQVSPLTTAKEIGIVFQDPENQIVTSTVWHELAFSLENFGFDTNDIRKKVAEMATFFGFEDWLNLSIHELSGGQKQLINLASILLLQPSLLLLDEPTAQLDPIAAREFLQMLYRINQEFNTTVVIIEHRLEDVFPIVDRVVLLENGKIKLDDNVQNVIRSIDHTESYFHYLPEITKLYLSMNQKTINKENVPITVREGKKWLESVTKDSHLQPGSRHFCGPVCGPSSGPISGPVPGTIEGTAKGTVNIIECKEVFFQYGSGKKMVLEGVRYSLTKGKFAAIIGGNGAGKSTLLKVLAGLESPKRGKVLLSGKPIMKIKTNERYEKIGYLSQNPLALFTQDTVEAELNLVIENLNTEGAKKALKESIAFFQLNHLLHKHPYDLSGGERQKLALACIFLKKPQLLLIDEPTKGLDPKFKQDIGELLKQLQQTKGMSILMVTHDVEFAAKYTDYCSLLFNGSIVAEGTPKQMFSDNYFYTTAINRLVRNSIPEALTYEEVLQAWNAESYS